jgi:Na+/H+ antiporter NhaD/arsenite permease-like protein
LDLAWISLVALVVTIAVSCTTAVNPGVLAIALAWLIGGCLAPASGRPLGMKAVVAGFPSDLFLTLAGVTLLFSLAQVNGTLERVTRAAVGCCRGNTGLLPLMFFGLTLTVAAIGAGNIAAAALVAPMAMACAERAKVPAFLMAIMVAHGAVAGALSPLAPSGLIAAGLMSRMGLPGHEWYTFTANLLANAGVALAGYLAFGGWRLLRAGTECAEPGADPSTGTESSPVRRHAATLALIAALIVAAVGFGVPIGMGAFAAAALMCLTGLADEREAVRVMPWSVILMVCGVTVLTSLLEKTGGIDLFTTFLSRFSTPRSAAGVMALVTGLVSVYSSTVGVVLPTFLPSVPGLVAKLGGGDPLAISEAILVGGHLVDVSPLSTIGALCVAGATPGQDRRRLFNQVLAWGLSMSLVGAVLCQLAFGELTP